MSKQLTFFERGYNLADTYIQQKIKNIDTVQTKNEEFKAGYLKRIEEEKIKILLEANQIKENL